MINQPKDFKDPTFTPLRNETGGFKKVEEPAVQTKKDDRDPDWDKINPDIIALAQRNGMARSALNLYFEGSLTWMEALETMVTALGRELLVNQKILVEVRSDYVDLFNIQNQRVALEDAECQAQQKLKDKILMIKCSCSKSDAWRCAVDQGINTVACHCPCHTADVTDLPQ